MKTHKAIVMGSITRKMHYFHRGWGDIYSERNLVEHKLLWSGDLENPPLEIGDYLYLNSENLKVKIIDKAKSTDGGYVYWSDYVIETIEDEITATSLVDAEVRKSEYEQAKVQSEQVVVEAILKPNKWYQIWK